VKALLTSFGALVVWGAVSGSRSGSHPGGPPTAATEIPTSGGHGTLIGVLVVVGLLALVAKAGGGRVTSGRFVAGHSHGGPTRTIARHEAGHAAAARALGGRVVSATADRHGGYVDATIPNSPRAAITFLLAGRRAAGTGAGCSADDAAIRAELRTVPRAERGQLRRDADRDARRIVNGNRGQIRRDAERLEREGSL
jgi:hypothetical protein